MLEIQKQVIEEAEKQCKIDVKKLSLDIANYLLTPAVFEKAYLNYRRTLEKGLPENHSLRLVFIHGDMGLKGRALPNSVIQHVEQILWRRFAYKIHKTDYFMGETDFYIKTSGMDRLTDNDKYKWY